MASVFGGFSMIEGRPGVDIDMRPTSRMIASEADTAAIVERRSAECGLSAAEFFTLLVAYEDDPAAAENPVDAAEIAELDRRRAAIRQSRLTVDHADVRHWLKTWGTAGFTLWPGRR